MKKLLLPLALIPATLCMQAQVKSPDFAYPQKVCADATKQLERAQNSGDDLGMLNALMQLSTAKTAIDNDALPALSTQVLHSAGNMRNSAVRGLATLYAATLCHNYYEAGRYKFNSRDLPLQPRPGDMAQWSGRMFEAYCDSLVSASWALRTKTALDSLASVIKCPSETRNLFKWQADAMAAIIIENHLASGDSLRNDILSQASAMHTPGDAADCLWTARRLDRSDQIFAAMQGLRTKDTGKSGWPVMWCFVPNGMLRQLCRDFGTDAVTGALTKARQLSHDTWLEKQVAYLDDYLHQPSAMINTGTGIIPCDTPFAVKLTDVCNLDTVTVDVYRFKDKDRKIPASYTPLKFSVAVFKNVMPADTTVLVTLPAGYYGAVIAGSATPFTAKTRTAWLTATGAVPTAVKTSDGTAVIVSDAISGKPLPDVPVKIKAYTPSAVISAKTDSCGLVFFNSPEIKEVSLTFKGRSLTFNASVFDRTYKPDTSARAVATTNLPVYAPGDTVQWLAVASDSTGVVKGKKFDISLQNPKNKTIAKTTAVSDAMGRLTGRFAIPADAMTGDYQLLTQDVVQNSWRSARSTWIAVADFTADRYRIKDLAIQPKFKGRDTVRISGSLATYGGDPSPDAAVNIVVSAAGGNSAADTVHADAEGKFEVRLPYPPQSIKAWMAATVKAVAPDGQIVTKTESFNPLYPYTLKVKTGLTTVCDSIVLSASLPVQAQLRWSIYRDGQPEGKKQPVKEGQWDGGHLCVDVRGFSPGGYLMRIAPVDTLLADASWFYYTVYDRHSSTLPVDEPIWTPDQALTPGTDGRLKLKLGVSKPGAYVYATTSDQKKFQIKQWFDPGFHDLTLQAGKAVCQDGGFVTVVTSRGGKTFNLTLRINRPKDQLAVSIENMRDKVNAGTTETLTLKVTDSQNNPVSAAVAATIYNARLNSLKSLAAFKPWHYIPMTTPWFASGAREQYTFTNYNAALAVPDDNGLRYPQWLYQPYLPSKWHRLKTRGRGAAKNADSDKEKNMAAAEIAAEDEDYGADLAAGAVYESKTAMATAAEDGLSDDDAVTEWPETEVRKDMTMSALWQPVMQTDSTGIVQIPWHVPAESTEWQMNVTAWVADAKSAAKTVTFTAVRPVTVNLTAPRFLRVADRTAVVATLRNNSSVADTATVVFEARTNSDTTCIRTIMHTPLGAHSTATALFDLDTALPRYASADTIFITSKARIDNQTDAERIAIPLLPSQCNVTDARNFYIDADETNFETRLPPATGNGCKCTLNYTSNAMWTVVEALRNTGGNATVQSADALADAIYRNAAALHLAAKHPEIRTYIDQRLCRLALAQALSGLEKLQTPKGGFKWCIHSIKPSAWATQKVLSSIAALQRLGYQSPRMSAMATRALPWYDDAVQLTDLHYTLLRPSFANVHQTLNGQKVSDRTVQYIIAEWRNMDIATKAMSALAMQATGNRNMARTITESLVQFGTKVPGKGIEFRNLHNLISYALLLETVGTIMPGDAVVDGIRQYIIYRRQGTVWQNTAVTTAAVAAMLATGTDWATDAGTVHIAVNGKPVDFTAEGRAGFVEVAMPVENTNSMLQIDKQKGKPAYGAVVSQYIMPMTQAEAFSDGELAVTKTLTVVRDAKPVHWQPGQPLRVGDMVRVTLTLSAPRPLDNVIVSDQRPAAFVPQKQLSGRDFADGLWFYRENRDGHTDYMIERMPKGTYVIETLMRVQYAGTFATGTATATCSQAPSLTAHSSGFVLEAVR